MPPGNDLAASIQTDPNMLCLQGPILAMADVVFPCPGYLDGTALHCLRQQDCVEGKVGLVFASEAAAQP